MRTRRATLMMCFLCSAVLVLAGKPLSYGFQERALLSKCDAFGTIKG